MNSLFLTIYSPHLCNIPQPRALQSGVSAPHHTAFTATETARLLPFPKLFATLKGAVLEYAAGHIRCPERLAVPLAQGGVMLSMPAVAPDLAAHKLVNVCPVNRVAGRPTIQGTVTAYDALSGTLLFTLDAPTVTARRTAAISMLGIALLHGPPQHAVIIGTGSQAQGHLAALRALFPDARLSVVGRTPRQGQQFAHGWDIHATDAVPDDADVVITTTTSKTPVYSLPARPNRLLIGTGAFTADAAEISAQTVQASQLFVDDLAGAQHEAGDLIQAGVNWPSVRSLAEALTSPPDRTQPIFFKTVGCAAWDLAACRVAHWHLEHS